MLHYIHQPLLKCLTIYWIIRHCDRCHTVTGNARSFIPAFVDKWNDLDNSVFADGGLGSFKTLVNRSLLVCFFYFYNSFFMSAIVECRSADHMEPGSFSPCRASLGNNQYLILIA